MNHLVQYVACALLNSANHSGNAKSRLSSFVRGDYEVYRGSIGKILQNMRAQFGPHLSEKDVEDALILLNYFAAAEAEFSPAAKAFWNIKFDNFRYYFIESDPDENEDDTSQYFELKKAAESEAVLMAYARNGSAYIEDAIEHIAQMDEAALDHLRDADKGNTSKYAPGADRIVTLDHNQQADLDNTVTDLIQAAEQQNGIEGDVSLRQRVVGQLKAGRELIRAQAFNAHLMYQTLMTVLGGLIEKYKDQAIGQTAKKLLDLLIEHVFHK